MIKFQLTCGSKYDGGFKLNVSADSSESQKLAAELTKLLISKIEKIVVEIKGDDYEE